MAHAGSRVRGDARELRQRPTDAELKLWSRLRGRRLLEWKFRRQHPIGPYVLDFFCAEALLAVELDGGQHNDEVARVRDDARSDWLRARGIQVLRFWNDQVLVETDTVLEQIWTALRNRAGSPSPQPSPPKGERERSRHA